MKTILIELRAELQAIIDNTHQIQQSGVNGLAGELNRDIRTRAQTQLDVVNHQLLLSDP